MEPDYRQLLVDARRKAGLTQVQMAAALGVSQPVISGVESGSREANPRLVARLTRFTEKLESPRTYAASAPFDLPAREWKAETESYYFEVWQSPEAAGDFASLYSLPNQGLLFVCLDMAGRGTSVLPSRTFVEGWLSGYLSNALGAPRVEEIAQRLSVSLKTAGFQLSGYFAVITPSDGKGVNYEAACFSMPQPLLLLGPPYESRVAAEISPALPVEPAEIKVTRITSLPAPWKIIAGSDGLLERLGGGDEQEGRRQIRKWFTGHQAMTPLKDLLVTGSASTDDEVCALLEFTPWDMSVKTTTNNYAERTRILATLRHRLAGRVKPRRLEDFMQAVLEAMDNAAIHAYPSQGSGPLIINFREEATGWRVEVADNGIGIAPRPSPHGGLKVFEQYVTTHFISRNRGGGTTVTLQLESKPKTE